MTEEQFTITYSGPAVNAGRMSVRELAPALIALADALREAQHLTHPFAPEPALDITASREGSFEIDLLLRESGLLDRAIDLFSGRETTAAVNLTALVGYVFGAFAVIRRLGRNKIRNQQELEGGQVRLTFDDGQTLTVPRGSLALATDQSFREAARNVVAPVSREGIQSVELTSPKHTPVRVESADLTGFDLPPGTEEQLVDSSRVVALRPVTVAFQENNKWRVSDGDSTFYATIRDDRFLSDVALGQESFAKSDLLRAELRTRQWRTISGDLRTEHEIVHVIEHIHGPREVPLPFEDIDANDQAADPSPQTRHHPNKSRE